MRFIAVFSIFMIIVATIYADSDSVQEEKHAVQGALLDADGQGHENVGERGTRQLLGGGLLGGGGLVGGGLVGGGIAGAVGGFRAGGIGAGIGGIRYGVAGFKAGVIKGGLLG